MTQEGLFQDSLLTMGLYERGDDLNNGSKFQTV